MTNSDEIWTRYLFGELSDSEQTRLEEHYFTDAQTFEQLAQLETELVDGYARGRLSPQMRERFERAYLVNPNRLTSVRYRAPYSDHWEDRPLDWAMDRIAQRIKETRDVSFVERTPDGKLANQTTAIATLGGATMDIEENYLIKKLFSGGLGVVSIENQARI